MSTDTLRAAAERAQIDKLARALDVIRAWSQPYSDKSAEVSRAWMGALVAMGALAAEQPQPIDMILHCPACGMQHIDAPEKHPVIVEGAHVDDAVLWDNPPHRSHLCHGCGHIWRPADVPTNGVAAVKTRGKADSPPPPAAAPSEAVQPAGLALVGYIIGSAEESDRGNEWVDCRATQAGEFNVPVYRVTTAPAAAPTEGSK